MNLKEKLKSLNNVEEKDYLHLPSAFSLKKMYDVIDSLKKAGFKVFDLPSDKNTHLARKNEMEIYFNNEEAVCTVTDYGETAMQSFPLALEGNCSVGSQPNYLWLNI